MGCKKLLFNNIGGSVTPPPPEGNSPIMDGLVCWLDGRDNIIGNEILSRVGTEFTFSVKGDAGGVIKKGGAYFIKGTTDLANSYLVSKKTFDSLHNKPITVIVNAKGEENSYYDFFIIGHQTGDSTGLGMVKNIDNKVYSYVYSSRLLITPNDKRPILEKGATYQVLKYDGRYFYDKVNKFPPYEVDNSVGDFVSNKHYAVIGRSGAGGQIRSKNIHLYSLMIYDRILTEEEINHNYQYELYIDREPTIPKDYVEVAVDGTTTGNLIEPFLILNLKDSPIEDKTYGFCKCTFSGTSVAAMYFKDETGTERAFNIQMSGVSASKTYYLEFYGETGVLKLRVREDSEDGKIVKVARDTYTDIKQINITKIARISTLQCRGC